MTKSQNTKNEQHFIKQNEKSFIQKDLSLTELWQKGELPSGEYWCLSICGDVDKLYCYQNSFWKYETEDDYYGLPFEIKQVLAHVPSYDEWQASEKYNKHLEEVIKVYERKDKQAIETSIAYNELLAENEQLKELLKECKKMLMSSNYQNMTQYHEVLDMRDKIEELEK